MKQKTLSLEAFKEMDYYAVNQYNLPIELMMENAGLQLARLIKRSAKKSFKILIGVGNGNNGGGGLVAARRLAAWGFDVYLDIPVEITKELPRSQLKRALAFGAKLEILKNPDIWVDAYLGFSQKLPLSDLFLEKVKMANESSAFRISLDIPTGISEELIYPIFNANQVLTMAAPKTILLKLASRTAIFIADLGIPKVVYDKFKIAMPRFSKSQIVSHPR